MADALRVENLRKTFHGRGGKRVIAVDGISFTVKAGQIFGLLGPNGAGKTTTIRVLSTLIKASSGLAEVAGFDVAREPLAVRGQIVVVLQESAAEIFLTVRDNLITFGRFHGLRGAELHRRADRAMEYFGLTQDATRKAMDLSGGFRRRIQVAKAVMVDAPVMFLDEFSTGMDPILKRSVMDLLRQEARRGRTIILTTQILAEAEALCDDILIVNHGREVVRGDVATIKALSATHNASLEDVFIELMRPPADGSMPGDGHA